MSVIFEVAHFLWFLTISVIVTILWIDYYVRAKEDA